MEISPGRTTWLLTGGLQAGCSICLGFPYFLLLFRPSSGGSWPMSVLPCFYREVAIGRSLTTMCECVMGELNLSGLSGGLNSVVPPLFFLASNYPLYILGLGYYPTTKEGNSCLLFLPLFPHGVCFFVLQVQPGLLAFQRPTFQQLNNLFLCANAFPA